MISLLGMKMLKLFGGNLMRGCHVAIAQYQRTAGDGDGVDCDDSDNDSYIINH